MPICAVECDNHIHWSHQHLRTLECYFKYTPYFDYYYACLEGLYQRSFRHLIDLIEATWALHTQWLNLNQPLWRSSQCGIRQTKDVISFMHQHDISHLVVLPEELPYYQAHFPESVLMVLEKNSLPKQNFPFSLAWHHAFIVPLFHLGPSAPRSLFSTRQ